MQAPAQAKTPGENSVGRHKMGATLCFSRSEGGKGMPILLDQLSNSLPFQNFRGWRLAGHRSLDNQRPTETNSPQG